MTTIYKLLCHRWKKLSCNEGGTLAFINQLDGPIWNGSNCCDYASICHFFYVTFKIRSKFTIMKMMCMQRPILSLPHTLSHIDPGRPGFISNWSHLAPPTGANQITFRWKNFSNSDWQLVRTGLKKSKTPTISFFVLHDDGMELRCEERNILWRCQRGARICVMVFIWSPFSF